MTLYDIMAVVIADCDVCGAKAGDLCRQNSNKLTKCVHWQRKAAVQRWRKADHQELYRRFRREVLDSLQIEPEYGLESC